MRVLGYFALLLSLVLVGSHPSRADQPKAEQQGKALRAVAAQGQVRMVQTLLDSGVDINAMKVDVTPRPGEEIMGWTALMAAASKGQTPIVRLLLARGADANREDHMQLARFSGR